MLAVNLTTEPRKRCTKCGRVRVLSLFGKGRGECKICKAAADRAYYEEKREKIIKRSSERYATDPKHRARVLEYHRERYSTDLHFRAEVKRRAVARAPEARAKRKANVKWALADRVRENLSHALNRRAYKKHGKTFELLGYTPDELRTHLEPFIGKPCVRCSLVVIVLSDAHIDHVIPMRTAASKEDVLRLNALENLRLICASCNLHKQGRIEE